MIDRALFGAALLALAALPVAAETAPGTALRDCEACPELVVVPAGTFAMGSPETDKDAFSDERPQRTVRIARPFAIGKYEVTFAEYDACTAAKACRHKPGDEEYGRGRQPVFNVSWNDAQAYIAWLRRKTGKRYRLPSEAEWEYAARGGTSARFAWGEAPVPARATCYACGTRWDGKQPAPVGSFPANGFGLFDVNGNVWEWTQDCWNDDLAKMPLNGAARLTGKCTERVLRGGSYLSPVHVIRTARRDHNSVTIRDTQYGFRVARGL
ncbi:MAG: formylglycine-generating enzyme family protein [Rhodospirillaceae bacterium]|nr:formylglycine-generating enzyme family protein [Rhodospirillaceae bacterium]